MPGTSALALRPSVTDWWRPRWHPRANTSNNDGVHTRLLDGERTYWPAHAGFPFAPSPPRRPRPLGFSQGRPLLLEGAGHEGDKMVLQF